MKIRLTKEQFDYVMENYFSPHGIKNVVYEKIEENNHVFYDVELVSLICVLKRVEANAIPVISGQGFRRICR